MAASFYETGPSDAEILDFSMNLCYDNETYGDVPKWLKGADSKSARRRKACGGSNPSISAKMKRQVSTGNLSFYLMVYAVEGFEPI